MYIVAQVQPGGRDDKLEILREGNDCTCTTYSTSLLRRVWIIVMKSICFVEVERLQNMLIKKDKEPTELKEHRNESELKDVAIQCSSIVPATG